MASADVTIGDAGGEFECDATPHLCTLTTRGGRVRNTHATQAAAIMIDAAIASATAPLGNGGLRIVAGAFIDLPRTCGFMATGTCDLQVEKMRSQNGD